VALEHSLRSEKLLKSLGEKATLVDVFVNMGSIYLGLHDLLNATQCGDQAMNLLDEFTAEAETEIKGCALRLLGDIALALHHLDEAQKQYRQAELIFDATTNRLERGRLLMSKARLVSLQANHTLAKSYLMQAGKLFTQLGARLDLRKLEMLKKELAPPARRP
jgi:tetratricopeptide (TPR) repeat protein